MPHVYTISGSTEEERMARHYGMLMGPDGVTPLVGAAAGAGVGTATAILVRQFTSMDCYAELIGMGTGVLTGLGMMIFEDSRSAGVAGVVTAIMNNGVRFAAGMISDKEKIRNKAGELASLKKSKEELPLKTQLDALTSQINALKGTTKGALGLVRPAQVPTLAGQLGALEVRTTPSLGAVSTHDPGRLGAVSARTMPLAEAQANGAAAPPVNIVGAGNIGAHYGATVMG